MQQVPIIHVMIFLALLGWRICPEPAQSWLFLPVWIAASWLIFRGCYESARLRRRAWLGQYLRETSPWHRRLRGGPVMICWHLLLAALLALFMLVALLALDPRLWLILLLNVPLLALATGWLNRRIRSHVKMEFLPALLRRFVVPVNVLLMIMVYLPVSLSLSQPNMLGLAWNEAITRHLENTPGHVAVVALLERLYRISDLTLQWAMQNTLGDAAQGGALAILGWSLLLLMGTAFIWAWVRLLVGASTLFDSGGPRL